MSLSHLRHLCSSGASHRTVPMSSTSQVIGEISPQRAHLYMAQPCFFPSYQYSYFSKVSGTDRKTFLWGGKIQSNSLFCQNTWKDSSSLSRFTPEQYCRAGAVGVGEAWHYQQMECRDGVQTGYTVPGPSKLPFAGNWDNSSGNT